MAQAKRVVYTFVSPSGGTARFPLEIVSMDMSTGVILSTYTNRVYGMDCIQQADYLLEEVKRMKPTAVVADICIPYEILQLVPRNGIRIGKLNFDTDRMCVVTGMRGHCDWGWQKLLEKATCPQLEAWIAWEAQ